MRAKSGLLRGREFMMKDFYSFHADEKDRDGYYETMTDVYKIIFSKVGLGKDTYFTFASGGTFSKYSHEFQTVTKAGEDTIHICDQCRVAINDEILKEQKTCPQCNGADFRKEKSIEVGNIFKLKNKFTDDFNLKFKDKDGLEQPVIVGCYGIGLGRLMGAIAEVHNDQAGIVWSESVAPFKIHLIKLAAGKTSGVEETAEKLYKELLEKNIEVLYDDREDISPGEKLVDSDLIGIPWRIVVSEKTLSQNKIELKKRSEKQTQLISQAEFLKLVS